MKRLSRTVVGRAVRLLRTTELTKAGSWLPGYLAIRANGITREQPVSMNGDDFAEFIDRHYRVSAGGSKPYYEPLRGAFKYNNWPRGTFLSRSDRSKLVTDGVLDVEYTDDGRDFALTGDPITVIPGFLRDPDERIALVPFAIWMMRGEAFEDDATLDDVVALLLEAVHLPTEEVDILFTREWTGDDFSEEELWSDEDWNPNDCRDLVAGTPVAVPADEDFLDELEVHLRDVRLFDVPRDFLRTFVTALRMERFAVLTGKPGTGKTRFVYEIVEALQAVLGDSWDIELVPFEVHEETDEWDLLGSRDLRGSYVPSEVMERINSYTDPERTLRIILLDEMNRALVDVYAGRLLSAVRYGSEVLLPGDTSDVEWLNPGEPWSPPAGTMIVGCINSHLMEPGRLALSGPVKRRGGLLPMPNPLVNFVGETDETGFREFCTNVLLPQRCRLLEGRGQTRFDGETVSALEADVPDEMHAVLWGLSQELAADPLIPFTVGILQDVLAHALASGAVMEGLDAGLTLKVVPLIRGDIEILDRIGQRLDEAGVELPHFRSALAELRSFAERNAGRVEPLH